ncbi:MAG: hypothetical protein AAFU71_16950 [Cyanobacteria bacterium J06632_22]
MARGQGRSRLTRTWDKDADDKDADDGTDLVKDVVKFVRMVET